MKNFVLAVFALTAAGIIALFARARNGNSEQTRVVTPQTITVSHGASEQAGQEELAEDTAEMLSFIPLQPDELLLQTLSSDFDGDGFEDQINAVRHGADADIILLVALYDPPSNTYKRAAEINTGIMQPRTFTYTCVDITGTHRNALVFQGFLPSGDSVMKIFHGTLQRGIFSLAVIGDFRSDGTIFIQRVDRSDSYETLGGIGTSYPVWVYSSDLQTRQEDDEQTQSLDQLQTMYDWDSARGRYLRVRQTRVTGQRLAQSEIQRVQDGTVATFMGFLDGLWYKTGADDMAYVYFDSAVREVTFFSGGNQEIYSWANSTLRRNGIYLSTRNMIITNISRLVDVSLSGIDEIKLRIQDDVRMTINENAFWDGTYIKISRKNETAVMRQNEKNPADEIFTALTAQKEWNTETGETVRFFQNTYTLASAMKNDEGRFALMFALGKPVIEFRSKTAEPFFERTYQILKDGDAFRLEPVTLNLARIAPDSKPAIRLEANR